MKTFKEYITELRKDIGVARTSKRFPYAIWITLNYGTFDTDQFIYIRGNSYFYKLMTRKNGKDVSWQKPYYNDFKIYNKLKSSPADTNNMAGLTRTVVEFPTKADFEKEWMIENI